MSVLLIKAVPLCGTKMWIGISSGGLRTEGAGSLELTDMSEALRSAFVCHRWSVGVDFILALLIIQPISWVSGHKESNSCRPILLANSDELASAPSR